MFDVLRRTFRYGHLHHVESKAPDFEKLFFVNFVRCHKFNQENGLPGGIKKGYIRLYQ